MPNMAGFVQAQVGFVVLIGFTRCRANVIDSLPMNVGYKSQHFKWRQFTSEGCSMHEIYRDKKGQSINNRLPTNDS